MLTRVVYAGRRSALGQGYYWEVVVGPIASDETRIGIRTGALPADGSSITTGVDGIAMRSFDGGVYRNGVDAGGTGAVYVETDVVSVLCRGGFLWFAVNGVMANSGLPFVGGLTGTWRPAAHVASNAGSASVTAQFATASWTYTPPAEFASIGDAAVWVDENSVVLSSGDLTASKGTVSSRTPFRADTGFTIESAGFQPEITLADMT